MVIRFRWLATENFEAVDAADDDTLYEKSPCTLCEREQPCACGGACQCACGRCMAPYSWELN